MTSCDGTICTYQVAQTFHVLFPIVASSVKDIWGVVDQRHRSWLKRSSTTQPVPWRPKKIHRVSSKAFLEMWDNEIATSTCLRGLVDFRYDEASSDWAKEFGMKWKHFTSVQDQ